MIAAKRRRRRCIRYDDILSDDGTDYLVETVDVSDVVEGLESDCTDVSDTFRGRLRPVPPKLEIDQSKLAYGLCVDVYFSEAWWEGVLFDHENGSEKRRVFFPDLGDEMDADLQSLRITQDWNEGTETWECRGRWLFLDLIEKYKEDNYLPVSVKQLWYDIRDRIGFARIQEWTCSTPHLWEDLMLEVIDDNLRITINQFLHDYDTERYPQLKLLKEASQAVNETNTCLSGVLVIAPQEQQFSCADNDYKPANQRCHSLSVLTSVSGIRSEASYITRTTEFTSKKSTAAHKKMILNKKPGNWYPFDCVAKSCPQAVSSFIRSTSQLVAMHVRKHLKYMGWTIEHMVDEAGRHRFRYLSPDGRLTEHSLRQVCFRLKQRDESLTTLGMAKPPSLSCENRTCNTQEKRCIVLALPACNRSVSLGERRAPSAETLLECETQGDEGVFTRESRNVCPRNAFPGQKKKLRVRLEPKTKAQGSLRLKSRCKQKSNLRYNSKKDEVTVSLRNVDLSMRRGHTSRMLMDIKNRVIGRGKPRVLRSSKRVHRVITPISRKHSPRSILSWLIDNNVVLPRENIRCRSQKDDAVRKEGKLTREGIQCSCCRRIFTISGFQVHADGGSCRAAANIFLDDGRSLLECQVEAYKTRKKAQPPDILKMKLRQGENDVVCSVCHYGGKLILCDGCPSAFHANCLGLEVLSFSPFFTKTVIKILPLFLVVS